MSNKESQVKQEKKMKEKTADKVAIENEVDSGPFAIFESGSEQCLVREGQIISIEKFSDLNSGKVKLDKILVYGNGDDIQIGQPYLSNVSIDAELLSTEKDKKVIGMKFKKKTGYKKVLGHRQILSTLKIDKISIKSNKKTKEETA